MDPNKLLEAARMNTMQAVLGEPSPDFYAQLLGIDTVGLGGGLMTPELAGRIENERDALSALKEAKLQAEIDRLKDLTASEVSWNQARTRGELGDEMRAGALHDYSIQDAAEKLRQLRERFPEEMKLIGAETRAAHGLGLSREQQALLFGEQATTEEALRDGRVRTEDARAIELIKRALGHEAAGRASDALAGRHYQQGRHYGALADEVPDDAHLKRLVDYGRFLSQGDVDWSVVRLNKAREALARAQADYARAQAEMKRQGGAAGGEDEPEYEYDPLYVNRVKELVEQAVIDGLLDGDDTIGITTTATALAALIIRDKPLGEDSGIMAPAHAVGLALKYRDRGMTPVEIFQAEWPPPAPESPPPEPEQESPPTRGATRGVDGPAATNGSATLGATGGETATLGGGGPGVSGLPPNEEILARLRANRVRDRYLPPGLAYGARSFMAGPQ